MARMSFAEYCSQQGLQLLRDDHKYIRRMLYRIPKNIHRSVLSDYCLKWQSGMDKCENATKKQNLGRRNANLWLGEVCMSY